MKIEQGVVSRFRQDWSKDNPQHHQIVQFLTDTYHRYCAEKLADKEFSKQLSMGSPAVYQQRKGELLLADALWSDGFRLSSSDHGPDLILPLFHRHPVKRFNPLSEVNDEAEGKRETKPAAL